MAACPNFNDSKYKYLESTLGELEAYKTWHQSEGNLEKVLLDKAKTLRDDINPPHMREVFDEDPKGFLKQLSEQLADDNSKNVATRMIGKKLAEIAEALNDNIKRQIDEPTIKRTALIGKFQSQGIIGKRITGGIYEAKIDPSVGNPITQEEIAYRAQQNINRQSGKEIVHALVTPDGRAAIMVDPRMDEIVNSLDPSDLNSYRKYLSDNLYTNKNNPSTSELLNNAASMAKDLGRQDLTDMARLIYKYLGKNPTLSIRILDYMNEDNAKAYYSSIANRITFARSQMGTGSMEYETSTVLHELLHGLVVQAWRKGDLNQDEKLFRHVIDTYYNYFKGLKGANLKDHFFKNSEEFLMGTLMDAGFRDHLSNISKSPKSNSSAFSTLIKDVLRCILRLFGIKSDDKLIEDIDPSRAAQDIFDGLSDYLGKMDKIGLWNGLKEDGRDYGLSFAVTAEQDYQLERNKMKMQFTPEMKDELKKVIDKSILSIKSFGTSIRSRIPESQEGFKTIFKQLKKLEDPAYNLDQIDFFFDFTQEIGAIMNVANDKISKLYEDETIDDVDFRLKEYESIVGATRNFDPILNDIQQVKVKFENLGMKAVTRDLNDMMLKRDRIESLYSMGVFPLVTSKFVSVLEPASKKAVEIASTRIQELDKRIDLANKHNNKSRVLQLTKERGVEQELINKTLNLDSDRVQNWLRGEMGDSNMLTTWFLAGVSSSNPVVAGVAKYIRDGVGTAAPKVLGLMNSLQDNLENYSKTTGRAYSNISDFNSPLIQIHKEITGKDKDGNYTYEDKYSLLHEFNNGHIVELQKFKRDMTDLYAKKREIEDKPETDQDALKDIINQIKDKKNERRQFLKDYMEQQYAPQVHDAFEMLYEDLGGFNVWDYMGPLISSIEDIEAQIEQTEDESVLSGLFDQLDDQNFALDRMRSLYEKSPDSNEFKVAQQIKKRNKILSEFTEFKLTDKGRIQFEAQKARMFRKMYNGDITKERYERWLEDNTVTELSPEYWSNKNSILEKLNDIQMRLGKVSKNSEEIQGLYRDMEDIVKAHRDANGIINGREMTEQEQVDVKSIEESLDDAKNKVADIMGLTKLEKMELSNIREQIDSIKSSLYLERNPDVANALNDSLTDLQGREDSILSKKKHLDKKLLKQYYELLKKLSELDEGNVTKYYQDESLERKEQEMAKVDISKMPKKFVYFGRTFSKSGDDWVEISNTGIKKRDTTFVEQMWREKEGEVNFKTSDWYKNNHVHVIQYTPNANHDTDDPMSSNGKWEEVEKPSYAWRQTRPKDEKYILQNQPSIKYKKRTVKNEYINQSYKEDINGDLRPKIQGAKDDRFINKDYQRISNSSNPTDASTVKMLRFLTDTYFKSQESIPKGMRPGYQLPAIRKSHIERLSGQNLKQNTQDFFEYLGQLSRLWKDDISANPQDKDILYGYNDDMNGIVPIKFLTDIDSKDQSIDLPKLILVFASEMMKRDELVKTMPFINAVKDIVNNPDFRPVKTKKGVIQSIRKKFLPKNTEVAQKASTSNTALQINEIIKSEIYGEKMKDVPGTKLVNSALGIGAKLMLGFNFISSVQNYANAFTQSIMETESKNKNFTMKNFIDAQKIYYGNINPLMSDLGKYGNKSFINQFFDYFGGINFKVFSKNDRSLAYGKSMEFLENLSVPNTITEHMLNYHMALAIALNYRVSDGNGNMIPIFDAFTLKDRHLVQKEGFNITQKDRDEMISRLNTSSRRVNGEYGDRILADKYMLGKLATFMNRYLIPFVVKRYGARRFDIQDGVRDEGYWRLLGKVMLRDIKSKSLPLISGWKYYTSQEKTAILKAMTEFGFTIMFALMISALGGGDDKHLKDNSRLANNLIYALKGIQQQNEAFMPVPGVGFDDLFRKIQNPFPILSKVKNMMAIINDGSRTLWYELGLPGVDKSDVLYSNKTGWHNTGDFKVMSDFEKLLGIQRIANYLYPEQAIKGSDTISRIK